ncbi:unnamed protein product [Alternaria alternata]
MRWGRKNKQPDQDSGQYSGGNAVEVFPSSASNGSSHEDWAMVIRQPASSDMTVISNGPREILTETTTPLPGPSQTAGDNGTSRATRYRTGLNNVYEYKSGIVTVDIVAVHGLNGEPFKTWSDGDHFWLQDFLPKAIPSSRIFTFGYTADVFSRNDMDILDCARSLLAGLDSHRTDGVELRPLVFIGHSLGGIVIKAALLEAKERGNPAWNAVLEGGIMFMAVPHGGADLAYFASSVGKIANLYSPTNTKMLNQLKSDSRDLWDLSRRFGNIQKNLRLASVLEAGRTPLSEGRRGSTKVVEDESARLNLGEDEYKIDGSDHRTVCKFSDASHPEYIKVQNSLKRLAQPTQPKTPGNGKTVLTSSIVDNLRTIRSASIGLAYFYCDYRDAANQSLSQIFGCLCAQISRQNNVFRCAAARYLATFQKSNIETQTIDYKRLINILVETCSHFDRIYLVIDAVDEFMPPSGKHGDCNQRIALLETLSELEQAGEGTIKILLTSRPTGEIQNESRNIPRITITKEANSEDIELYVRKTLEATRRKKHTKWGNKLTAGEEQIPTMSEVITSQLTEKADGMFLFAALQLKVLLGSDKKDVSAILRDMPKTLEGTWERIISVNDESQDTAEQCEIVKHILQWLVAAARPLKLYEISAAIAVPSYETYLKNDRWLSHLEWLSDVRLNDAGSDETLHDPEWLLELCGPLVRSTSDGEGISLAHFSLKENLISGKLRKSSDNRVREYDFGLADAHTHVATVSLTYLCSRELSQPFRNRQELNELRQIHRLMDYATVHGGTHLSYLSPSNRFDDKLIQHLKCLLIPEMTWTTLEAHRGQSNGLLEVTLTALPHPNLETDDYESWPADCEVVYDAKVPEGLVKSLMERTIESIETHQNCKTFLQLFRLLSEPMRKDHPVNVTPLYYAALFGWRSGVERLLNSVQDRVTTSDLNHALRAAAMGGFSDIIKLLTDAGASVDADLGNLGSPVQTAISCGHVAATDTLLKLGADLREEEPYYRTGGTVGSSMQAAAETGNIALMQRIIEEGGDLNCNDGWLGTPLQSVLEKGKHEVARWIIDHPNFTPNVTGGYYGSASRFLCFEGSPSALELLRKILDLGGFPSERVSVYGSLLEIASHFGHKGIVELLLNRNAELDGTSMGQFGNAVHAAAMRGDEEILYNLLLQGGDPNCAGQWLGHDLTPNRPVSGNGYGRCVQLIQGTGFLAFDHSWVTKAFFAPAIHAALRISEVDHNKIFLLFENEPTHRDGHFGNPLQGAAFRGHTGVLKLLLAHGARIDAQGGFFGTALQAAASQRHVEAVEFLLEQGADPNIAPSGFYGSSLAAAIALGFGDIIQALVEKGARYDCFDENGWSAQTWETLLAVDSPLEALPEAECRVPSAWSIVDKSPDLRADDDGRLILSKVASRSMPEATALANHPVTPYQNFYFEITVEEPGPARYLLSLTLFAVFTNMASEL